MRIGMFTDTYTPQINGVATSVSLLKRSLEAMGHDVFVFTTTDPEAKGLKEDHVYRVPSAPVFTERRLGVFYHPGLAREVRQLNLDLINTHTEFSLGIFGRNLSSDLNLPLVHTYHTIYEDYTHFVAKGQQMNRMARSAARALTRSFCNIADEVVVPTNKVKELLMDYGVVSALNVVPTGLDLSRFETTDDGAAWRRETRAELGLEQDRFVLVNIGRVSAEKNIQEIIQIMGRWLPSNPEVRLVVVGDGPYRKNLEQLAQTLKIQDSVIFAGYRPFEKIAAYYRLGDVFISASQSETQGLTYIEALSSGLPVVARNDRCLEGVVEQGINGFVYESENEAIEYLDRLASDRELGKKLGIEARRRTERISSSYFADSILQVYQMAIESSEGIQQSLTRRLSQDLSEQVKRDKIFDSDQDEEAPSV